MLLKGTIVFWWTIVWLLHIAVLVSCILLGLSNSNACYELVFDFLYSLVGNFESDALLVPPRCRFEHMHFTTECQTHDQWHERAVKKCNEEGMIVKDYGVLIPCGVGTFTGVEFVCCPDDVSEDATDAVKIVPVSEAASTSEPLSVLEHLKMEISKFAKHVEGTSVGMFFFGVRARSMIKNNIFFWTPATNTLHD